MDNYNVIKFYTSNLADLQDIDSKYNGLSNFYSPKQGFLIDKQIWPSTEHYFQAMKFSGDNMDKDIAQEYIQIIKNAKTPYIATVLGKNRGTLKLSPKSTGLSKEDREYINSKFKGKLSVRPDWDQFKFLVMLNALTAKFTQNKKLFTLLTSVPDNTLFVEHTQRDKIWGDGGDGGDDTIGKNILGKMLTSISFTLKHGNCSEMNNKLKAKIDIRAYFFGLTIIKKLQSDLSPKEVKTLEEYMSICFDINYKIGKNDKYCWYLVYKEFPDDKCVLLGSITVDDNDVISNVCTNPLYRGLGVATIALNNAISIICRKTEPRLFVNNNGVNKKKLLNFYSNLGFEQIGMTEDEELIIMEYSCGGKLVSQYAPTVSTEQQILSYIERIYHINPHITELPIFELDDEKFTGGALSKFCVEDVFQNGVLAPFDSEDDRLGILKYSRSGVIYYFIVRVFTEFNTNLTIDLKLPSNTSSDPCLDIQFFHNISKSGEIIPTISDLNGLMYSSDDIYGSCIISPLPKDNLVKNLLSIFDYLNVDLGFKIAVTDDASDIRSLRGICGTEKTKWGDLPISISASRYLMMLRGYSYYNNRGFVPTSDSYQEEQSTADIDKKIEDANKLLKSVKNWSEKNKSIVPRQIKNSADCTKYFHAEKKFIEFYTSAIKKVIQNDLPIEAKSGKPKYNKYYKYKIPQGVYTSVNDVCVEVTKLVDTDKYPKFEFDTLYEVNDPLSGMDDLVCDDGLISDDGVEKSIPELGEIFDVYCVANGKKPVAGLDYTSYGKSKLKKLNVELINKVIDYANRNGVKMIQLTKKGGVYLKSFFFKEENYTDALRAMMVLLFPENAEEVFNLNKNDLSAATGLLFGYTRVNIVAFYKYHGSTITVEEIQTIREKLNRFTPTLKDLKGAKFYDKIPSL